MASARAGNKKEVNYISGPYQPSGDAESILDEPNNNSGKEIKNNDGNQSSSAKNSYNKSASEAIADEITEEIFDRATNGSGTGKAYFSADAAAAAWTQAHYGGLTALENSAEWSSVIYSFEGADSKIYYTYSAAVRFEDNETAGRSSPGVDDKLHQVPYWGKKLGTIHYHPPVGGLLGGNNENFSAGDDKKNSNDKLKRDYYLVNFNGDLKVFRGADGKTTVQIGHWENGKLRFTKQESRFFEGTTTQPAYFVRPKEEIFSRRKRQSF
jgi:hypothetical protein